MLPIAALAFLIAGCSDKNEIEPVPTPGKDVVFAANALQTRTEYQTPNADGSYPIWWLPNDQMLVMSPQCAIKHGQYQVGKDVPAAGAASAGVLQKIGDAGVQWGESATADFYSVYPYMKVEANGIKPDTKTVTMRMPHIQNDYIHNNGDDTYTAKADMDASFLYAQTNGVQNGADVQLGYKSLSTAIRFTLVGPAATNAESATIQYIKITAADNTKVAGNMDVVFGDNAATMPTVSFNASDSYDHVYVYSSYEGATGGGYLVLNKGQKIELNAFVMLQNDCNIENWTIEVQTLSKKYTKKLGKGNLVRGMIHNLGELPALDADSESEWDVSNWMVNIPRNTYISEISLPGSWNSANKSFQTMVGSEASVRDLQNQYNVGVRAFHFDTRWKWNRNPFFGQNLTSGEVANLGIADGSESYNAPGVINGKVMNTSAIEFAAALNTLAGLVQPNEYMMLFCTFAQNSYENPNKQWYEAISEACASVANSEKIYNVSEKGLSPNTTVKDVLGSLVVVINMEGDISTSSLPANSKCLYVSAPLTLTETMFSKADSYNKSELYSKAGSTGMLLYNTQAQISSRNTSGLNTDNRGYAPTLSQRELVAGGLLDWSRTNFAKENYEHNAIIYMGLGGYTTAGGSHDEQYVPLTKTLNKWIDDKIKNMSATPTGSQTPYFPVGVVFMNFTTNTTYGTPVVKDILLLNNLYQKEFDPNQPAWPNTGGTTQQNSPANYSAAHTVAGNAWTVKQ